MGKELHAPLGQTGKPESGRDWRIVFQFLSARLFYILCGKVGVAPNPNQRLFPGGGLDGDERAAPAQQPEHGRGDQALPAGKSAP